MAWDRERLRAALARRAAGAHALARIVFSPRPFELEGDPSRAEVALVSNWLPPLALGWPLMLDALLGSLEPVKLLAVGPRGPRWGARPRMTLLSADLISSGSRLLTRHLGELVALEARRAAKIAARTSPRLRRVFATFDVYMPFASALARAAGAELWLYAIDDHAGAIPEAQRRAIVRQATRVYGLSSEMARHLREAHGASEVGVLPPLARVPAAPAALPAGAERKLLFVGSLLPYQRQGFESLAAGAERAGLRIEVLTESTVWRDLGWELPKSVGVVGRGGRSVHEHVCDAHVGLVVLGLSRTDDPALIVAFPSKLRDYFAAGRPVLAVVPRNAGAAGIVRDNRLGWVASDEKELQIALEEIRAMTADELAALGARAYAFAREHLDASKVGEAFVRDLTA